MTAEDAFLTLKSFLENRPAAKSALKHLREKTEIGIVIGEAVSCALFRPGQQPVLEKREAKDPDVVFHIKPQSVYTLANNTGEDVGDFGVLILKECMAGSVRISLPGSLFHLLTKGYLEILAMGGQKVMSFLGQHGFGGVTQIVRYIRSIKSPTRK